MSARLAKRPLVEPDYWTCPHGVRVRPEPGLTYGPEVADLCDKAGYTPDPQQELGLDLIFAIRPDGSPASFSGCVICARQNLKSGLFLQACVGWLFVIEVPEIAWSAHELRTSLNAQRELYQILESPALSKYLPATLNGGLYDTNGKERVELNTGQTVWFQTRTRDGGRGLGKPKVILDEAFKLKARVAGALLPILLAQHHPQLLYGSSAPPLDADSEVLRDVIDRGRNHKSPELWYLEWLAQREECADPGCAHPKDALERGIDCALDREHLIRQANPTLTTGRITMRTLRALRQELPPLEYMRECLGWAEESVDLIPPFFGNGNWEACRIKLAAGQEFMEPPPGAIGIAVSIDREWASIGAAAKVPAGVHVGAVDRRRGVRWTVSEAKRIQDKTGCLVAIDGKGPASSLVTPLEEAGVTLTIASANDVCDASELIYDQVQERSLQHLAYDDLEAAVEGAEWREIGDRRAIGRRKSSRDVSMLEGVALADWALAQRAEDPPPAPFFLT